MFDEHHLNAVQQADLLYLPHDRVGRKTFKYAFTIVDVTSRYKESEPMNNKSAAEVAAALDSIYKQGRRLLQAPTTNSWAQFHSYLQLTSYRYAAELHKITGSTVL